MIAVIADIHSNLEALKKVLAKMKKSEMILNAGDIVGYNAKPNECIELVKRHKIVSVLGNHGHACITGNTEKMNPVAAEAAEWTRKMVSAGNMEFLKGLPKKLEKNIDGKKIVMVHGSPRDPVWEYVFPWLPDKIFLKFLEQTKADILIMAHTHIPFVKKLNGKLVINPGAVGQPRDHRREASHAVIDLGKMDAKIIRTKYDIPRVSNEIIKAGLPDFLAERLFFGM